MTRFDIAEARNLRLARRTRWFHGSLRVLFGLGIAAASCWTAGLVVTNGWTATDGVVVGIEVVAAILFGWIFVMTGRSADFLEVNDEGVELEFARGRTWQRKWNDAGFRLNLFQTQDPEEHGSTAQWIEFGSGAWPVTNYLTVPAFDAVLQDSRRHGLSLSVRPLPRQGCVWYRLSQQSPE